MSEDVTVLVDGLLVHGHLDSRERSVKGRKWVVRNGIAGTVSLSFIAAEDEGLVWVHGHVTEKDPVGAALLVAGALKPQVLNSSQDEFFKALKINIEKQIHLLKGTNT